MKSFFEKTFKQEKKIHTLIYNVYSKPNDYYKKFEDYDDKVWEKVMQSNLSGAYKASKKMIREISNLTRWRNQPGSERGTDDCVQRVGDTGATSRGFQFRLK